jgi:hypothetical protein
MRISRLTLVKTVIPNTNETHSVVSESNIGKVGNDLPITHSFVAVHTKRFVKINNVRVKFLSHSDVTCSVFSHRVDVNLRSYQVAGQKGNLSLPGTRISLNRIFFP